MESKNVKLNICYGCMSEIEERTTICPHCGYICSRKSNPQDALPEGTVLFRKYLVGKVLGRGGFGVTYLGYDLDLQIRVAIKEFFPLGLSSRSTTDYSVLPSTNGEDDAFSRGCAAFLEEARTLASFNNRYTVHVRDYFREHGTAYLVMDYVDGKTLSAEIADNGGKVPPERLLSLMKPLILQLDKLHKKNIIHRDIAPDNLVIVNDEETGEEHFVLLDFGAARSFVSSKISQKYTATVKNGYAPIEQYSQKSKQGPFTDVYALCATIYAALTGVVPPSALERSADGAQIEPLSKYGVNLPAYVEQAILHGLAQNAEERTQTMQQLYDELTTIPDARELEYKKALTILGSASAESDYQKAEKAFSKLGDYKDSTQQAAKSKAKAEECHKKALYTEAKELMVQNTSAGYKKAIEKFSEIGDWQDAKQQLEFCRWKCTELSGGKKKVSIVPILLAILIALGAGLFAWKEISKANEQSRIRQEAADAAVQQAEDALKATQEKLKEAEKARTEAEAEAQLKEKEAEDAKGKAALAEKAMAEAKTEAEKAKEAAETAEKAMAEARAESEARAEEVERARAEAETRATEAEQAKAEAEAAKKSAEEAKALAEAAEKKAAETEKTVGASAKEAEDALKEARAAAEAAERKAAEAEALAKARADEAEKAKAEAESAARSAEEAKAAASAAEQRATEATEAKTVAEQKAEEAATAKAAAEQKAEEATAAKQAAEQKAEKATEAQKTAEQKAEAEAKERKEAEEREAAYYHAVSLFTNGSFEEAKEAFLSLGEYRDSEEYAAKCEAAVEEMEQGSKIAPAPIQESNKTTSSIPTATPKVKTLQVGDYIEFGSYEQDNDLTNGKEPIEWRVLDVQNGAALLISNYALDAKEYHNSSEKVSWSTCSLHTWLNDNFLKEAFSDDQIRIVIGEEKVFLLSAAEAKKYFSSSEERICLATKYAISQGTYIGNGENRCSWWLNTAGVRANGGDFTNKSDRVAAVNTNGTLVYYEVNSKTPAVPAVRPAIWISIDELSVLTGGNESTAESKQIESPIHNNEPVGAVDQPSATTITEGKVSIGDYVTFGAYEQDNDLNNGKEPVEWLVLEKEEDKILVISRYALDCQQFHAMNTGITWETSSLRRWLNNTFMDIAFNADEQAMIPTVTVRADDNPIFSTNTGNQTTDQLFLLSISEARQYFSSDAARQCEPTKFAKAQGCYTIEVTGTCWWWLRSPGRDSNYAAVTIPDGSIRSRGEDTYHKNGAVRPAMWISTEASSNEKESEKVIQIEPPQGEKTGEAFFSGILGTNENEVVNERLVSVKEGDVVYFGLYEQDNNNYNGREGIEWIVLAEQDDRVLLLSKYALDCQPFEDNAKTTTWETSFIRSWLNTDFYDNAFSQDEKEFISRHRVDASINSKYGTSSGNDTNDYLFLLSIPETELYFKSAEELACKSTLYAATKTNIVDANTGNCWWWLRTSGNGNGFASGVTAHGLVHNSGNDIHNAQVCVRPAMWVSERVFRSSMVTFGHYEQDNDLTNGPEAIDWLVLEVQEDKVLLLSKKGLDVQKFNYARKNITWEDCSLRKWLEEEFYFTAFTEEEQDRILKTTVTADGNPKFDTDPGNNTEDKVFLLSISEVENYLSSDFVRHCEVTNYAKEQSIKFVRTQGKRSVNSSQKWMLRSPGVNKSCAADVLDDGSINYPGDGVGYGAYIVRPAIWVRWDNSNAKEDQKVNAADDVNNKIEGNMSSFNNLISVSKGDYITFGSYEQDNDFSNGEEPIEWLVLDAQDDKAMLISNKALDCQRYNSSRQSVTWEESTLREWLNNDFLDTGFTMEEQRHILETNVVAERNSNFDTSPGKDTKDKIFLLSISEKSSYLSNIPGSICQATEHALSKGAQINRDNGACRWWLRTPGYLSFTAAIVSFNGHINSNGNAVYSDSIAIRPVMWISLDTP